MRRHKDPVAEVNDMSNCQDATLTTENNMEENKEKEQEKAEINANADVNETENEKINETVSNNQPDEKAVLQQKLDETNDKYLRLYSEFDNYRKRTLKEKLELMQTASLELIQQLLPVVDDFERALANVTINEDNADPMIEGVKLIYNKFVSILAQKGLEEMKCLGETFNPELHEAIANVPASEESKKNTIADVVVKGYLMHGKVIRYAKVVVAN